MNKDPQISRTLPIRLRLNDAGLCLFLKKTDLMMRKISNIYISVLVKGDLLFLFLHRLFL